MIKNKLLMIAGLSIVLVIVSVAVWHQLGIRQSEGLSRQAAERSDKSIQQLMQKTGATAVMLAVAKDGKIIYEHAYGFKDADSKIQLDNTALMRVGSVLKPITAATVRSLAAQGVLSLSDHAFCNGHNTPCWLSADLLSPGSDPRVGDITLQDLIAHQAGWDSTLSGDPAFEEPAIKKSLQLDRPPTREEIVKVKLSKPLDYVPGHPKAEDIGEFKLFSNFGYMVLGLVIEKASHDSYASAVQHYILPSINVPASDFVAGASLLKDRHEREPHYVTQELCPSVFAEGQQKICAEEMRDVKNWQAVGFSLTNARTLALFAQHYTIPFGYVGPNIADSGLPLQAHPKIEGKLMGDMEGLTSVVKQFPSGVSYAWIANITIIRPDLVQSMEQYNYYYDYFDETARSF